MWEKTGKKRLKKGTSAVNLYSTEEFYIGKTLHENYVKPGENSPDYFFLQLNKGSLRKNYWEENPEFLRIFSV